MMRIARVVPRIGSVVFAIVFCCAAALYAQPAASSASADSRGYAEVNVGPTFGHKSDVSVGGEGGYQIRRDLFVFAEVGHIGNAASSDLDSRATIIANNAGAAANVIAKVTYFDAGIRYQFVTNSPRIHPYVVGGFGAARVTTETTFSVNGSTVPPETLGITVGSDLAGSQTAPYFSFGGGANVDLGSRYFSDISYRYGRVFSKTEQSGSDTVTTLAAFNTNRLQLGLGIKF
jgi:opacity protein-like surface antigen